MKWISHDFMHPLFRLDELKGQTTAAEANKTTISESADQRQEMSIIRMMAFH